MSMTPHAAYKTRCNSVTDQLVPSALTVAVVDRVGHLDTLSEPSVFAAPRFGGFLFRSENSNGNGFVRNKKSAQSNSASAR